jgi:hypothetical protein
MGGDPTWGGTQTQPPIVGATGALCRISVRKVSSGPFLARPGGSMMRKAIGATAASLASTAQAVALACIAMS